MIRTAYPVCAVLENVRATRNVGHIVKHTCLMGGRGVALVGITSPVMRRHVMRASLGAEQCVSVVAGGTAAGVVARVRCWWPRALVVAVETTPRSVDYRDYFAGAPSRFAVHAEQGVILIFGNEVDGVSPDALAIADAHVHLPLYGSKTSLNVSDCAAVVLSHLHRVYRTAPHIRPAHLTAPACATFPALAEYPPELSSRPPNPYSDAFTDWANPRLGTTTNPKPYG